ncbi:FAD-binding protein [Companilactobacillus sp.]|uniref:FAD-binding protein n=1 Tax=Companilactobacillus sp. TaxID=2767905 RepID=UPI0025C6AB6E|nr:FAD-binding protein [Companilactobacillus sp.]MCH4009741.1 FAD-binding protein [Companilactobacillus sp.]MCH4052583.1 FAD-binding protein [Companilactobacillus sp.]MCH4077683.1 FAD-binding protein [Companilactobacillus sp.]MCH4126259.1 FAD-binding protein [Companilactobacillus sp.]MCI1311967.1 FAD-binding protein [Companilactobacillus sp.]
MFKSVNSNWDATYDVVVLGFGGAGATAARFAADNGSKVLIVDSAPEGHEGGNTRYAGQVISTGSNLQDLRDYYDDLADPLHYDKDLMETYVQGLYDMPNFLKKYLGVKPFVMADHPDSDVSQALWFMRHEYPELRGQGTHDLVAVHEGVADSALWKNLRQQVLDRADSIDVLYETPAEHIFQDPYIKSVIGVEIKRDGKLLNVKANNGVVMATGGFENNPEMVENYLGETSLNPIGSLYNKGAGVKMAEDVGAKLYNMANYESYGIFHGLTPKPEAGQRSQFLPFDWPAFHQGSLMVVGDDGTRYFDENEMHRHGHIQNHGQWRIPNAQIHPYVIFDEKKYDELVNDTEAPYPEFMKQVIKVDTLKALSKVMGVSNKVLKNTIKDFNRFAKKGYDAAFHRDGDTLTPFNSDGPYYALPMVQGLLNTQGGPVHNKKTEVLDPDGNVIPHLYAVGELGSLMGRKYNGGSNLAEDLVFGKIAGEEAAKVKAQVVEPASQTDATASASKSAGTTNAGGLGSDAGDEKFETGKNQFIGKSTAGMGNEVVVRVTVDDDQNIKNVEVLKESESEDYGLKAIKELPKEIVAKNSVDVDSISGASASSKAVKEAVSNALKQANEVTE